MAFNSYIIYIYLVWHLSSYGLIPTVACVLQIYMIVYNIYIYIHIRSRLGTYCSYSTNVSTMASHREPSSIFLGFPLPGVYTFSWLKGTIGLLRHCVGNVAVWFSKVSNPGNWALIDHVALWLACRSLSINMAKHQPGAFATLWHLMKHWNGPALKQTSHLS